MGYLAKLNAARKKERSRTRAFQLSKALQTFYATHPTAPWQQKNVNEIRALYERRIKDLEFAHDHAASRCSEEFMQLELDYITASFEFRSKNPGMEWHPSGVRSIFAKAFWKNLGERAKRMGVIFTNGKTEAKAE